MKIIISKLSELSLSQKIFTGVLLLWLGLNLLVFGKEVNTYEKLRQYLPGQFVGNNFLAFQPFLKETPIIGYYTDKNLSTTENDKRWTQAQFILSPTVLEAHNTNHRYIIFDCSTLTLAAEKMKSINAVPLKITPSGIILAEKK